MFIWLVVGQWQNNWLWIYNSSHISLVKTVVMTNELFSTVQLLSLPLDLFLSQTVYTTYLSGGLKNYRYTRIHSSPRSPAVFPVSLFKTAGALIHWGMSRSLKDVKALFSSLLSGSTHCQMRKNIHLHSQHAECEAWFTSRDYSFMW